MFWVVLERTPASDWRNRVQGTSWVNTYSGFSISPPETVSRTPTALFSIPILRHRRNHYFAAMTESDVRQSCKKFFDIHPKSEKGSQNLLFRPKRLQKICINLDAIVLHQNILCQDGNLVEILILLYVFI